MKDKIVEKISTFVLENAITGFAIFAGDTHELVWSNKSFNKQVRLASIIRTNLDNKYLFLDFFDGKDNKSALDLFENALQLGFVSELWMYVKKGKKETFPAEIRLRKTDILDTIYISFEVIDLSITKLYTDLQKISEELQNKIATLMDTQAEFQHSIRLATLSDIGADIAHQIINPILIMQENKDATIQQYNILLENMKNFAINMCKFSDPLMADSKLCDIKDLLQDVIVLNSSLFVNSNIELKYQNNSIEKLNIFVTPYKFLEFINYLIKYIYNKNKSIFINNQENKIQNIEIATEKEDSFVLIKFLFVYKECNLIFDLDDKIIKLLNDNISKQSCITSITNLNNTEIVIKILCITLDKIEDEKTIKTVKVKAEDKITILHVEDEKDIRLIVKKHLIKHKINVFEAEDGQIALNLLINDENKTFLSKVNIIISDIRMPNLIGPRLLCSLRQQKINIPFIFFSSNLIDDSNNHKFDYENVYYVSKDSGFMALDKLVLELMGKI